MSNAKTGMYRGCLIEERPEGWTYVKTGERVEDVWKRRPCGICGERNTPEGHDACLGTLPGVQNACCGHGVIGEAYAQFDDGAVIRGPDALQWFAGTKPAAAPRTTQQDAGGRS